MLNKRKLSVIAAAAVLLASGLCYLHIHGGSGQQHSVLTGTVSEEDLVKTGMKVKTGDVLVKIHSVSGGSVAAARADFAGTVREVLVRPGERITAGQTVVILSE